MEEVLLVDDIPVEEASPKGGIITIWTLNRPNKLNALNNKIHEEIKSNVSGPNQMIMSELSLSEEHLLFRLRKGKKANPLPLQLEQISQNLKIKTQMM